MTRESDEGRRTHPRQATTRPITWRPVIGRELFEARVVIKSGRSPGWYVGYVARTLGDGDDEWRGYVGITHVLVSIGRREAVQAAVERAAREAWATRIASAGDQGQRDTAYRSDR